MGLFKQLKTLIPSIKMMTMMTTKCSFFHIRNKCILLLGRGRLKMRRTQTSMLMSRLMSHSKLANNSVGKMMLPKSTLANFKSYMNNLQQMVKRRSISKIKMKDALTINALQVWFLIRLLIRHLFRIGTQNQWG